MATAAEGAGAKQALAAALAGGIETLAQASGEVTFSKYVRLVLPLDGYVFWVKTDLVSQTAMLNMAQLNSTVLNEAQIVSANTAQTITVKGSFHYSTQQNQDEAENEAVNTVIFTAERPIQLFNDVQQNVLWIAEYGGDIENFDGPITFAFSSRGRYYQEADLFHYAGTAVLPAFKAQLINSADQLAGRSVIASNSLPVWLQLSNYDPPYDNGINNHLQLYPSFLVPDNLLPPYGVVHIFPESTESLQSAPFFNRHLSQFSLSRDRVRVTLYGLDNEASLSFLAAVLQFSADFNTVGVLNMPSIRDEKRVAPELGVLAQKKTIEFEVSYQQHVVRNVARQMIETAVPTVFAQAAAGIGPPFSSGFIGTFAIGANVIS
jgi:hypothetical protein